MGEDHKSFGPPRKTVEIVKGRRRALQLIFKIVPRTLWLHAQASGFFAGAPVDVVDGFIHFSTSAQIEETAARHFTGKTDLLLVAVDPQRLGDALRWDISRNFMLFPHLYAPLALADVTWVKPLPLRPDGTHDFTGLLP